MLELTSLEMCSKILFRDLKSSKSLDVSSILVSIFNSFPISKYLFFKLPKRSFAPSPVTASILRTPAEIPDSEVIFMDSISPVSFTWVPPQSSTEKPSPKFRTLTSSPYLSPKNAIAPFS